VGLEAEGQPVIDRLGHPLPLPVGSEDPRVDLVVGGGLEDGEKPSTNGRVVNRDEHLHPAIETALHDVGGAQVEVERTPIGATEPEDARVLEVTAHDRPDSDALRQPGDAGAQAATPAHDEIDPAPLC
jgi:hypothetical protein